jgi:phage-related tail protein
VPISLYARRVLRRWYLVVLGVVVAVGLVFLHAAGTAKHGQYSASATVYMGQPVTPSGAAIFSNPPFVTASAVSKVIGSESALAAAAKAAGGNVTPSSIDGKVTAHLLSTAATTTTGVKTSSGGVYYEVDAEGPWGAHKASAIANALAAAVATSANSYVNSKVAAYNAQIATEKASIQSFQSANDSARREVSRLTSKASSSPATAVLLTELLSMVSSNTTAIGDLQTQLSLNTINRSSALNMEAAKVSSVAFGHTVTATNRRSSLAVAAFVGLLVGVGLALAWDAVRSRPKAVA